MSSSGHRIKVREAQIKDVELIANYWMNSTPEHLLMMGVDLTKVPERAAFTKMLTRQISLALSEKQSYALIWEVDGLAVGHSNVNVIEFGRQAKMHLHLWVQGLRHKGIGTELVRRSLSFYFEKLHLELLICEPYAKNPAPNKTLAKLGFQWERCYRTIPGSINFEQEVNRWNLSRKAYEHLIS
jgi:RimJ/RimL family protein N-acetyltransferase